LFVALASKPQAAAVAATVSRDLLKTGGIVTTPLVSGQQWDAPNGWPPLQWIGVSGLRHYSISPLADSVACRWMVSVNRVYAQSSKLVEKYDVMTTGRVGGDGFGWTNGVMRKLMALYPQFAGNSTPESCGSPGAEQQ
jgi:alpha,alpha-trehalase